MQLFLYNAEHPTILSLRDFQRHFGRLVSASQ